MTQAELESSSTACPITDCGVDLDFIFSLDADENSGKLARNGLPARLSLGQLRAVIQVAINIFVVNHGICSKGVQEYLLIHPEYREEFISSIQDMVKELSSTVPQDQDNEKTENEKPSLPNSQEASELTQQIPSSLEPLVIDKNLDESNLDNVASSSVIETLQNYGSFSIVVSDDEDSSSDLIFLGEAVDLTSDDEILDSDQRKRKRQFLSAKKNNHYSITGKKQRIDMSQHDPSSIPFETYLNNLREGIGSMISMDQRMFMKPNLLRHLDGVWPVTDNYILSERFQTFRERMHLPDPLPIAHPVIHEIACCGYTKNRHDWKRYEWIGDRFLLVAISWHGVTRYPDCPLLNNVINFMVSNRVFIPFCMILGLHESNGMSRGCNQKEYANAFEAYFCGLYLEYGEKAAREYVSKLLGGLFHNLILYINDYKNGGGDESNACKDFDLVLQAYFGIDINY